MAYDKTNWQDHIVADPNKYQLTQNPDGTITLVPKFGEVIQQGTPLGAENLNKIENEIKLLSDDADNFKVHIENADSNFLEMENHIVDYVKHSVYPSAVTLVGNRYDVTLEGLTGYIDGMGIVLKIPTNTPSNYAIKVNNLLGINVLKPNGTQHRNPTAGAIYSYRYSATALNGQGAFILQGEGGSGNAQVSEVLTGKTFTNDTGEQVGTMRDMSNTIVYPQNIDVSLTEGYYKNAVVKGVFVVPVIADYGFEVFNQGSYVQTSSLAYTAVIRMTWLAGEGTIRLTHGMYAQYNYAIYSQVYINGVAVGIERQSSSTDIYEWTQDFNVKKGDVIEIRARANTNAIAYIVRTAIKIRSFYLVNRAF